MKVGDIRTGLYLGTNLSATRSVTYDQFQRLCRRFDPEAGNTLWGYDLASQMVWQAKGQSGGTCTATAPAGATLFSYDTRGRKTLDDYPGTADDVAYGYDAAGNPTRVVNPVATWTYAYNKRNLPETEQAQIDGHTYLIDPAYNSLGQPATLTYPDTLSIAYAPNAFGEPTQLTASCCGGAALGVYASGIQHYPNGVISGYSLGNGLIYSQGLDNRQRLNLQATKSGTTVIQQFGYSYSNAGDLKTITDPTGVDSANLGYDGLHRLISASGVWGGYTYGYGDQNNLVSRSGTNPLTYSYEGNNRLASVSGSVSRSYNYDALGQPAGDGIRAYSWSGANQITFIPGVGAYAYDGNGRRIKTIRGSGELEYAIRAGPEIPHSDIGGFSAL